uniref:Uncharacterized protein n=1 Tax=Panagrolaimus davidi TaxID=227884 RepID=A0A914Q1E1_9BILA
MKNIQNVSDKTTLSGESIAGRRSSASGAGIEIIVDEGEDISGGIGGSNGNYEKNILNDHSPQKWTNIELGNPEFIKKSPNASKNDGIFPDGHKEPSAQLDELKTLMEARGVEAIVKVLKKQLFSFFLSPLF